MEIGVNLRVLRKRGFQWSIRKRKRNILPTTARIKEYPGTRVPEPPLAVVVVDLKGRAVKGLVDSRVNVKLTVLHFQGQWLLMDCLQEGIESTSH